MRLQRSAVVLPPCPWKHVAIVGVLLARSISIEAQGCDMPQAPAHGRVMAGSVCDPGSAEDLVTCDGRGVNLASGRPAAASEMREGRQAVVPVDGAVTDGDQTTGVTLHVPTSETPSSAGRRRMQAGTGLNGDSRSHVTVDLQQIRLLSAVTIWYDPCPVSGSDIDRASDPWDSGGEQAAASTSASCRYENDGECDVGRSIHRTYSCSSLCAHY